MHIDQSIFLFVYDQFVPVGHTFTIDSEISHSTRKSNSFTAALRALEGYGLQFSANATIEFIENSTKSSRISYTGHNDDYNRLVYKVYEINSNSISRSIKNDSLHEVGDQTEKLIEGQLHGEFKLPKLKGLTMDFRFYALCKDVGFNTESHDLMVGGNINRSRSFFFRSKDSRRSNNRIANSNFYVVGPRYQYEKKLLDNIKAWKSITDNVKTERFHVFMDKPSNPNIVSESIDRTVITYYSQSFLRSKCQKCREIAQHTLQEHEHAAIGLLGHLSRIFSNHVSKLLGMDACILCCPTVSRDNINKENMKNQKTLDMLLEYTFKMPV